MSFNLASDMSSGAPSDLSRVLQDLTQHEFPVVDCPPGLDKRASVALIIRINPIHPDPVLFPELPVINTKERVGAFFEQPWVTRGNAEVLFIKRAARKGDRWQGSHTPLVPTHSLLSATPIDS